MGTDEMVHERRKVDRKKVKITFLFRIGKLFSGRGIAKDMNLHGMCLVCPKLFRPRPRVLANDYIGATLQVMIPAEIITVTGVIAWVDLKKGEGGIRITNTSDDCAWNKLCEQPEVRPSLP